MRAHLLYRDRDFDLQKKLPWNERDLTQDLELETLWRSMAGNDEFLPDVIRKVLLSAMENDLETVLYRQNALKDCLKNAGAVRALYHLLVETTDGSRKFSWGIISHYPSSMVYGSIDLLDFLLDTLRKLRDFAQEQSSQFESEAFRVLFAMFRRELDESYLVGVQNDLAQLKFRDGLLFSAQLGEINESAGYVLRQNRTKEPSWFERILGKSPPGYTFYLDERDEAGARIVSEMRQRALSKVAVTLARSGDHVLGFIKMLRAELAFYIGCLNLDVQLAAKGMPRCFPTPLAAGQRKLRVDRLYDVCLSLRMEGKVVGNTVNADGNQLIVITGANQGGKSTFLRSIGIAQMMMQVGMFVGAEAFEGEMGSALFTHYKREEDATMKSGKFDEELARMSQIADHLAANGMLLFNESFAATNDREGSEVARQIVSALLEKHIKVFYVTHLYEFARGFFDEKTDGTLFLRAERKEDGTRTFQLREGAPLETSYGEDLYRQIFNVDTPSGKQEMDPVTSAGADEVQARLKTSGTGPRNVS